jgi:cbb3-type cytochrome c oxidase subunit III
VRKLIILLMFFAAGVVLAGGVIVWRGIGTKSEPSALEIRIARALRRLSIGESARQRRNPILVTPDVIADGRAHWADHCAICHGNDGAGDTEIGRNLYPRAPDMRLPATQELTDGELFTIIRDGVRLTGMPGWGGTNEDNWKLVHFVRHIPHLNPEEITIMERLNPKSPAELEQMRREDQFLKGH